MTNVLAMLEPGGYLSPVKLVLTIVLLLPWLYATPWVQKDAKKLHIPGSMWNLTVLGVGTISVLIWLIVPFYALGAVVYVLLTGGAILSYTLHRDSRVEAEHRVLSASNIKKKLLRERSETVSVETRLKIYRPGGRIVLPPSADSDEAFLSTYNTAQKLLYDIVWRRASQADMVPDSDQAKLRLVIDGLLVERSPIPSGQAETVIQYLKELAGMDVEDRRRPQKGKISVDLVGQLVDIDIQCAGTTGGQRMQFRVVHEYVRTSLDSLGMTAETLGKIREINKSGKGLIIVSGKRGSGITSTLYSLLRDHDAYIQQLVSLEAKETVDLENITQYAYGQDAKLSKALASLLRRDPDVVMVDQCPNEQVAAQIVQASMNKTVLLGMRAEDSFQALARWVQLVGDAESAVASLKAVLCQMLLRKLCPSCHEPYMPDPAILAKANLSGRHIERFYRPPSRPVVDAKGNPIICSTCQGMGYVDRTAAFELLKMTDELKQAIVNGASLTQLKATARKGKMLYLQELALQKIIDGITSVQELIRVSQADKKST